LNEFTPTPIKRIGRVVTGKTPSTAVEDNYNGDYMFVTPAELHTDFFVEQSEKTLSQQGLDSIRTNSINGLSIAVGCIGWDMGNVALINEECATNQQINSITDIKEKNYNPYYLYYWLLTKKAYLFQISTVTRTPLLNKTTFEDVLVPLPSKPYQDRIASVLLPISRKIALNNSINAELEKTAKLLYDYWFVQYDFPNAEGKPYRASGGEMVYNEQLKREIPIGWKVRPFEDIYDVRKGSLITEKEALAGTIKVVAAGLSYSYLHSESNRPANTITISASGDNAGYISFWREEIFASDCITVRGDSDIDTLLAYHFLRSMQKALLKKATGSAQPHVYPDDVKHFMICEIPEDLKDKIKHTLITWNKKAACVQLETKELSTLRDFLLPLLMNGQVTVADTAQKTAEVAADTPIAIDPKAKKAAVFKRLVLSAYILDNIYDEPTAGRVKFEKLLYLSEHCAELPLHSEFHRAAAGPYDSHALHSIESQLQRSKWFRRQKVKDESRAYARMANADNYKTYVDRNFSSQQKTVIDNLIRLFKTARTIQCEIVATLYGAWNDFLIDGAQPSDEQIVGEVLTNWHESKERIDRERWFATLGWMRQNGIVPTGYGVSTKIT